MKQYKVYVESIIKEEVIVEAENYEDAIEQYYEGNYIMADEISRQVIDTDANEYKEQEQ